MWTLARLFAKQRKLEPLSNDKPHESKPHAPNHNNGTPWAGSWLGDHRTELHRTLAKVGMSSVVSMHVYA